MSFVLLDVVPWCIAAKQFDFTDIKCLESFALFALYSPKSTCTVVIRHELFLGALCIMCRCDYTVLTTIKLATKPSAPPEGFVGFTFAYISPAHIASIIMWLTPWEATVWEKPLRSFRSIIRKNCGLEYLCAVALELSKTTVLHEINSLKSFVAAEEAACNLINCLSLLGKVALWVMQALDFQKDEEWLE